MWNITNAMRRLERRKQTGRPVGRGKLVVGALLSVGVTGVIAIYWQHVRLEVKNERALMVACNKLDISAARSLFKSGVDASLPYISKGQESSKLTEIIRSILVRFGHHTPEPMSPICAVLDAAQSHWSSTGPATQIAEPMVEQLLKNGADPKATDPSGRDPLTLALIYGPEYAQIVQDLANSGANIQRAQTPGITRISAAVAAHNLPAYKILMQHGANVNLLNEVPALPLHPSLHQTPLMIAAYNHDIKFVQILLKDGADPSPKDQLSATALQYCRFHSEWYDSSYRIRCETMIRAASEARSKPGKQ